MTAEDKKLVKAWIHAHVKELHEETDIVLKHMVGMESVRREIQVATGIRFGIWKCENCGHEKEPGYRDPRNVRVPACRVCGQAMMFQSQ